MLTEAKPTARLIVVSDSDFISDQYVNLGLRSGLQLYVANLAFVLNVIDWLAQDEALAQVRSDDPLYPMVQMRRVRLLQRLERTDEALKLLDGYRREDPRLRSDTVPAQ